MADEDDETFPPEAQKLPTEFAFREFGRISLFSTEASFQSQTRTSLLTIANLYGLVCVGYESGFKIYYDSSLVSAAASQQKPDTLVDVPLKSPPHWVAFSADNLTLVVCSSGDKGLQALFFDSRNLINKAKPTKTPFCIFPISKSPQDVVTSLHWNPAIENTQYLAVCVSSGSFHMLTVTDDVRELAQKPPTFGSCSACWSPRGKQVMVGKKDGSMQQLTPALEIRRTIPVYDAVEGPVRVDDILWLSTLQVAFSYTLITEDENSQSSMFVVNLPPAKEQNKSPSWRNYEDPCYGMTGTRPPHFMMSFVDRWSLFVVASTDASETAVIAKNKSTDVWEIWNLDDSCRAQLPMEDNNEEPYPLGVSVMYTAQKNIVVDDTRECGPMPVYVMLSCDGFLSLFHMINLQAQTEYPNLIIKSQVLTVDGERAAVPSKMGSIDIGKALADSGKVKLAVKPSLVGDSANKAHPSLFSASQLSTTPLHGEGVFGADKSGSSKFAPRSLSFPNQSTPLAPHPPQPIDSKTNNEPKLPTTSDPKPVVKKPLGKTFSVAPIRNESSAASFPTAITGSIMTKQQINSHPELDSSISSLSAASTRVDSVRSIAPAPASNKRENFKRPLGKAPEQDFTSQSSSSVMDSLVSEVGDFEAELEKFLSDSNDVDEVVATLDDGTDKLCKDVEALTDFSRDIIKTTSEQHDEIKSVHTNSLECYAALQNVETQRKRVKNPAYRSALYARPLDISDQRMIKEIRSLYHYIKETMKEVSMILDDQWEKAMKQKKHPSLLHKSKRRIEMEEKETIRQALINQTQILHNQEMNMLLLGQKLDKLRLLSTTWQSSYLDRPLHDQQEKSDSPADSSDLATLASSLIRRNKEEEEETGKSPQATRISPKKAQQLSEFLASRKTTIRSSYSRKSKFIAPPLMKTRHSSDVSRDESRSRLSSTTKSDYSEESEASLSEMDKVSTDKMKSSGYYFTRVDDSAIPEEQPSFDPPLRNAAQKPFGSLPSFPHSSLTKSMASDLISAQTTSKSGFIQGSSTFTYGGPESSSYQKPIKKFDPGAFQVEAASNLNNPPKVVNIKELSNPPVVNPLQAPVTFLAKSTVPAAVAQEVQKVLNTVHAEQPQPTEASHPTTTEQTSTTSKSNPPSTSFSASLGAGLGSGPATSQFLFKLPPKQSVSSADNFMRRSASDRSLFPAPGGGGGGGQKFSSLASLLQQPHPLPQDAPPEGSPAIAPTGSNPIQDSVTSDPPVSLVLSDGKSSTPVVLHRKDDSAGSVEVEVRPKPAQQSGSMKGSTSNLAVLQFAPNQVVSRSSPALSDAASTTTAANEPVTCSVLSSNAGFSFKTINTTSSSSNLFGAPGSTSGLVTPCTTSSTNALVTPGTTNSTSGLVTSSTITSTNGLGTPPTTNGLFAAPAITSSSSSTGLFGTTTTTSSNSGFFGAPTTTNSSTGLFGTPVSISSDSGLPAAPATTSSASGLFGTLATTSSSSEMLGTPATTSSSTGLFGTPVGISSDSGLPAAPATTSSASGLFGTPATTSSSSEMLGTPATTSSSTGLFGTPATTSSSTGLFGTPVNISSDSGLPSAPATASSTSGLFGTPATTSTGLFGAPPSTSSSTGLFGEPGTTNSSSGVFGAPTTSGSGLPAAPATSSSTSGLFGTPATTSTGLFGAPPNTNSSTGLFGAPATTSSVSGVFGATATTSSSSGLFGTPATTSSSSGLFGTPVTTSSASGLFGTPATTSSSSGVFGTSFGAPATTSSSSGLFGAPGGTGSESAFGGPSSFGQSAFGAPSSFGAAGSSGFGGSSGAFGGSSGGGGGGFLSGLGSTPTQSSGTNPFAANAPAASSTENKSLFGNTASSAFASNFGQTSSAGFGSSSDDGNKAFGSFGKPAAGGFGSPAVFGSPPSFGSKPVFGATPQFGSGSFGAQSSGFGSPAAFGAQAVSPSSGFGGSSSGFGAFAKSDTPGFGSLAQQGGSGGFGAAPQQSAAPAGFGTISQQSPSGGFGSMGGQQPSGFGGGFGSTPSKPSFSGWR